MRTKREDAFSMKCWITSGNWSSIWPNLIPKLLIAEKKNCRKIDKGQLNWNLKKRFISHFYSHTFMHTSNIDDNVQNNVYLFGHRAKCASHIKYCRNVFIQMNSFISDNSIIFCDGTYSRIVSLKYYDNPAPYKIDIHFIAAVGFWCHLK